MLSPDQLRALELLLTSDKHLIIAGAAGTGKSYLLQRYRELSGANILVAAPTGAAARLIGGETIHRALQLSLTATPQRVGRATGQRRTLLQTIDTLVLDEMSMLRADLLDCIDARLQEARNHHGEPFGGVRVIFFGDLAQLPPVVPAELETFFSTTYDSPFFLHAHSLRGHWDDIEAISLTTTFRFEDERLETLNAMLRNPETPEQVQRCVTALNEYVRPVPDHMQATILVPYRNQMQAINKQRLQQLPHHRTYQVKWQGPRERQPQDVTPVTLAKGARVRITANDADAGYVNGDTGTVTDLAARRVRVHLDRGDTVDVVSIKQAIYEPHVQRRSVSYRKIGTLTYMPVVLGWAATIHAAQGASLPTVLVETSRGMFAPGQLYVAVSRARSSDGLYLSQPVTPHDVRSSELVGMIDRFIAWCEQRPRPAATGDPALASDTPDTDESVSENDPTA